MARNDGAPKLIIHYAPKSTPRPDGSDLPLRTYCGAEDRSTGNPATSQAAESVDCLSCLRAYRAMWGGPDRILEIKSRRADAAKWLNGDKPASSKGSAPVMARRLDQCRARGCGGYLRGIDAQDISDGEIAECGTCGREHTFHVAENGATPDVTIARKPKQRAQ